MLGGDLESVPGELISSRIRDAVAPNGHSLIGVAHANGRLNDAVERLERDMIEHGLLRTQGNKSRLARELGISRSNLILKIQKYGLGKPEDALEDSALPRA